MEEKLECLRLASKDRYPSDSPQEIVARADQYWRWLTDQDQEVGQ